MRLSYSIVCILRLWRVGTESCGESILYELIVVESIINSLKDFFFLKHGFLWRLELEIILNLNFLLPKTVTVTPVSWVKDVGSH